MTALVGVPATLKAAPATRVVALPLARTVPAGVLARLRCSATDASGAPVATPTATLRVEGDVSAVSPLGFVARKSGMVAARCVVPESEGQPELFSAPVLVQIVAAAPARFEVHLYRQGACFTQAARLPLTWRVVDAFGNTVEDADARLSTTPNVPVRRDVTGGFIIDDEVELDVTLTPQCVGCEALGVWREHMIVDSTVPNVVITSPARAAMVRGAPGRVVLEGFARDALGPLESLEIANQSVSFAPGSKEVPFSVPIEAVWGVNIVKGFARDRCGNIGIVKQSFLLSEDYAQLLVEPGPQARVDHGVEVAFSQPLWDDEDRSTSHDVATLIQMALDTSDLSERLPHNLVSWPDPHGTAELDDVSYACGMYTARHKQSGVEIKIDGKVTYGQPLIEYVRAVEGGWHVALSLRDVRVPIAYHKYSDLGCLGGPSVSYQAVLVADTIRIEARPEVVMEHGEPQVRLCPSCVHIDFGDKFQRPHIGYASWSQVPIPQTVLNLIDWWAGTSITRLQEPLADKVRSELVRELETFLRGLRLEHSLPMPGFLEADVRIHSGLDEVRLHGPEGDGGGIFSLYGQFFTPEVKLNIPADIPLAPLRPRGAIVHPRYAQTPLEVQPNASFALRVDDDMVNSMLHALWVSGALAHENVRQMLLPQSGAQTAPSSTTPPRSARAPSQANLLEAANLRVFFATPPVLMPGTQPSQVRLGLGDVYAEADLDTYRLFGFEPPDNMPHLTAGFFFSALLDARLEMDPFNNRLKVVPVASPRIELQAVKNPTPAMEQSVNYWLEKQLNKTVPNLLARVLGSFPLPELQVGRMTGVPDNLVWVLDSAELTRQQGSHVFELQGALKTARTGVNLAPAPVPADRR